MDTDKTQTEASNTPRTDALEDRQCGCDASAVDDLVESYGHARQLERELSLSQEETEEAIKFSRQLELELRDWQRLQLWGGTPAAVEAFVIGQQNRIHAAQDLERELAEWKECAERLARAFRKRRRDSFVSVRQQNALDLFDVLVWVKSPP